MAAYNEQDNILRAISSILNQSYKDFEFLIINDGSTDKTAKIIEECSNVDKRIVLISKNNSGLADSLNAGLERSTGQYIARLDADDFANADRLKMQIEHMDNNPEIALLGSWCYLVNLKKNINKKCQPPTSDKDIRKYMQRDNPFIHSSVMLRKEAILKVACYNIIRGMEDYDLWIRIAKNYKVGNIPMFLVTRYESDNFYSRYAYGGLTKFDLYSSRLRCQLRAIRLSQLYPQTVWYIARTAISMIQSKLFTSKLK